MNYKLMRNCCFFLAAIVLFVMLAFIFLHTYNLWKYEVPKLSEENYTFFELLIARQKGAIAITFVCTVIPVLIGSYLHVKAKE